MSASDRNRSSSAPAWRLLRRLMQPYAWRLRLAAFLAVVQTALVSAAPALVGLAISLGLLAAYAANYGPLSLIGAAIIAIALGTAVLSYFWRKEMGSVSQFILFDLRTELFSKFQHLSVASHERIGSGRVVNHLTTDIDSVRSLFADTLGFLTQAIFGIVITLAMMLVLDAYLASVFALILLPAAAILYWSMHRVSGGFARYRVAIADATNHAVETIHGIHTVHAYGRAGHHDELFATPVEEARVVMRNIQIVRSVATTLVMGLFSFAVVLLVAFGGFAVSSASLDVGTLAAFILYSAQLMWPIIGISYTLDSVQTASAALARLAEVIETKPDVPAPTVPASLPDPSRGNMTFEGVSFGYGAAAVLETPARPHPTGNDVPKPGNAGAAPTNHAIHEMDLQLRQGEVVAMLGATGAGKSTIAKLIARFYDPSAGRILLDGIDLRDLLETDLRRAVIMITQEGFLFSGTIADNIRVGRPEASDDEVETAASAVGLDTFVNTLPDGYRTDVQQRGTRLSAGHRQLIAFARALLANPAVLILDEATAALDIPTERSIQNALRKVLAGRTALVIAHRLTTVQIADRLLVVNGGRIVEEGTPDELVARNSPEFAALYRDGRGEGAEAVAR